MESWRHLPPGQREARKRWGTVASGAAFDRKKTPCLSEQAQEFIAQRSLCVIAGLGPEGELCGLLAVGKPGFVQVLDAHTCMLQLDSQPGTARLLRGLYSARCAGQFVRLGLFFICHPTRERLCVQGYAELLTPDIAGSGNSLHCSDTARVCLYVQQAFFHCHKYIRTRVTGLTTPADAQSPAEQGWQVEDLLGGSATALSEAMQAFIAQRVLCFLCTVDQEGQCAVNHRGGAAGFLVTLPPDPAAPGGVVLLPDYAGNGAFEAIGNILETGQAALVIPDYVAQIALCVSGPAWALEVGDLSEGLAQRCIGAERVIVLSVQRVEIQAGDWSTALAYERAQADQEDVICKV